MDPRRPVIFLSAAEASGDEHAARLVTALRRKLPDARIVGVAGEQMAAAGCEVVADLTQQASMLGGPVLKLGYYIRALRRIRKAMRQLKPDVHVPVDSPALNWHLARTAKQIGATVVYYIAPQVWAWAPWRVRKMARLTDHVACILPFEELYLRDRGVNASYVGHPLLEGLPDRPDPMPDLIDAWSQGTWRVALLPGSRSGEIAAHCRPLALVAGAIRSRWPKAQCTFTARSEATAASIRKAVGGALPEGTDIVVGQTRQVLAGSHFAVAASGTVTLEVAYFGVPMVVVYRVGLPLRILGKFLGRWGIPTPSFSLVNILAGRKIVPELMPWGGRMSQLIGCVMEAMEEPGYLLETREELIAVVESLRTQDLCHASERTSDLIVQALAARRK